MQRLAKATAIATLEKKLIADSVPNAVAVTISRAVVDPADARRRLERLTQIRVPGGVVFALETTVWATAAVPYVVNNREASDRHFPAGVKIGTTEAARYRPLRPPTDAPDDSAGLAIMAEESGHLVWGLERSAKFLLENNDLTESIGAQGVMQHVTLAAVEVTFANGDDPVTMLATVDGSSRINSAHAVLGLTPHQVIYAYPRNERAHRQFISDLLSNLERPVATVPAETVTRLRALEIPARIFVRFEPDETAPVTFSKAVDSFVHLVHVEPPKPWDDAASLDAKADSVLNELLNDGQITPAKKSYFEGMLTPEEAKRIKYPTNLDQRALEIVALISKDKASVHRSVRKGILLLSKRGERIGQGPKAEIAVELALRGVRANLKKSDAGGARETLSNVYAHGKIWGKDLRPSGESPEKLRDAALGECDAGCPGDACLQLAAQGAYWLAVQRVLREGRFFAMEKEQRDGRTPQRVLNDLMASRWGIQVLYRAIVDGRDLVPIVQVDETGTRQKGVHGKVLAADHAWLRGTVVPPADGGDAGGKGGENGGPTLPDRQLLTKLGELRKAVEKLEDAHAELRDVQDASGKILVEHDGIAEETAEDLRGRLEQVRSDLGYYGQTWKRRNSDKPIDEPEPGVDEEPDLGDAS
jgi:hypothetical protein